MCFGMLQSSIGKKAVMAATGLILFGFVLVHMLGNLQIFLGQEWLNGYAEHLQEIPLLLWPARVFLLLALITHMILAIQLAFENKRARPIPYVYSDTIQASLASRTMVLSGLVIFFFILYHLLHFTFGVTNPEFFHLVDAKGRHDVYSMLVYSYRNVWISATYVLAMGLLLLHLSHGVPRFLQSVGVTSEATLKKVEKMGLLLAWIIFVGNSAIPLAVLAGLVSLPGGGV